MRAQQPEGPYYFGGMCQGAHIAFDMARVLESQNQTIGLLAIFDTWVIENNQNRVLWYLYYYGQRLKKLWNLPLRRKLANLNRVLRRKAKRVSGIVGNPTQSEKQNLWQASYWPGEDFIPRQVNTPITVFKIPEQPFYYVNDPLMGWASRTTKKVEIELIAAKHLLLLRRPWVRNLGQALSTRLRRAQGRLAADARKAATSKETSSKQTGASMSDSVLPGRIEQKAAAATASRSPSSGGDQKP